jgi:adenosylcobalamin-dependent ribonucleoside-triphosphate reductase
LKTFGGSASGHEPLKEMFEGIDKVLKNEIDPSLKPIVADEKGYGNVRPIHILDIGNLIGANVVVGGVRRTAEIFLFDADDYEVLLAKYGINGFWKEKHFKQHEKVRELLLENGIELPDWFDEVGIRNYDENVNKNFTTNEPNREEDGSLCPFNFGRSNINHRRMSNNSVAFTEKPSRKKHSLQFALLQGEGEPAFVNLEEAARRIAKQLGIKNPSRRFLKKMMEKIGLNPCVEIILFSKNVCNLTTVNVKAFIKEDNTLDLDALYRAQQLSTRIGLRMTLTTLELSNWDKIQKRDRLLGTSLTGWKDAMDIIGYTKEQEDELKIKLHAIAREEADAYSKQLRVNAPMLVTAVKPEGTLSQVAGGVSSGLHWSHSPYYVRRIRINANDPLVSVAKELGWGIHAETGTLGISIEEELAKEEVIEQARTLVIDFPIYSGAKRTKDDISVEEQFDNYFSFQDKYTEHNTSNTITVKENEWEKAEQIVWDGWDNFVGVSFLAHDGGTYLLAPYEAITEEEYKQRKSKMKPFDSALLRKYEQSETQADLDNMESCESGICPIR